MGALAGLPETTGVQRGGTCAEPGIFEKCTTGELCSCPFIGHQHPCTNAYQTLLNIPFMIRSNQ